MMKSYKTSAFFVNSTLNLAEIERVNHHYSLLKRERNLLLFRLTDTKYVGVFSFGVIAIMGAESEDELKGLYRDFGGFSISDEIDGRIAEPEQYDVMIDADAPETVDFDYIRLKNLLPEKVLLIFLVAAQSVAIGHLERGVDDALRRFDRVHSGLAKHGKLSVSTREVLRIIGAAGSTVHFIIDKLSLLDKPDITWEEQDAERLHAALRKAFELEDRFGALRFKIEFLRDSSENVLDVLQHRKSAMLEWVVIALIAIEIVLFLYQEFI